MAMRDFRCPMCGNHKAKIQRDPAEPCPPPLCLLCKVDMEPIVYSPVSVHFKGQGWTGKGPGRSE